MSSNPADSNARPLKPADCHIVAIIGARGGSKSLAKKNIRSLAGASRVDVIKSGRRIGGRVDIIPNTDFCSSIDIHDEFDLWLAEKIIRQGQRTIND